MRNKRAFTLIELMVVIAILGLIATIVLVNLRGARQRAKIAATMQFSDSLRASLSDALVSWWNLDEGGGNTVGDLWGGNTGTIIGASWTKGVAGEALSFDGNDYVEVADSSELRLGITQTIETWINVSANSSDWVRIVGKGNSSNRNYGLWRQTDGDLLFQIYGTPSSCNFWDNLGPGDDANIASDSGWRHIVATYNGTTGKIYIDGNEVYSSNCSVTPYTSADPLTMGYAGFHTYFNGIIDEVRIYSRGLTAFEIQKRYAQGLNKFKLAEK